MSWKLKDEELKFIDENEEQIKVYVGKKADYYMGIWREGKKFNPAALFLGMIWLGYRGMYKIIMYLIIAFILTDILMIFLRIDLTRISGLVASVILGTFGNYWYFLQVKKDILAGKEKCLDGGIGVLLSLIMLAGYVFLSVYVIDAFFYYIIYGYYY
ncbi:DUF2628 domain-containing protein [Fusobacterium sp.]|uniref:DUF2628 domain-containing protein n=1 Tax=Fusobacterium sp. TaxID=68766 RepID=UPI0028FE6DC7|nr:DUF2628 domain-containing protein [Fusobacterium sp.]MDU1910588.1 DUF2628 domain-containing protein [Fusobacterium sp.]